MKRVMLVLAALVLVASGVAMVSAYEAHTVNVKAHVENAMIVHAPVLGLQFGTVFPEEWIIKDFDFGVSSSFCKTEQRRVRHIDYEVYVVRKVKSEGPPVVYYAWLGDALYIGINAVDKWPTTATYPGPGDLEHVGYGVPPPPIPVTTGTLIKAIDGDDGDPTHTMTVGLDVPVFDGYHNELSDALANPEGKPSGLTEPTVTLTGERNVPGGIDLGADIVIQVSDIYGPPW